MTAKVSSKYSWRIVDIVVASVLAVACGLIFWVWNGVGYLWFTTMDALTPGLGGMAGGVWLLGGLVVGLVVRKPGAAVYGEVLAAAVSAGIGNQWGIETLLSGLAQGLGAELIFAIVAYRYFSLPIMLLAGFASGAGTWALELVTRANYAKSVAYNAIYFTTLTISGAILGGLVAFLLVRALATTGVLDRFPAGRAARKMTS